MLFSWVSNSQSSCRVYKHFFSCMYLNYCITTSRYIFIINILLLEGNFAFAKYLSTWNLKAQLSEFNLWTTFNILNFFVQDVSHCLDTGFPSLEKTQRKDAHILLKELRKIWENDEPNLKWGKDQFNHSNTLLVDNYPHTALLNPVSSKQYNFLDLQSHSLKVNVSYLFCLHFFSHILQYSPQGTGTTMKKLTIH